MQLPEFYVANGQSFDLETATETTVDFDVTIAVGDPSQLVVAGDAEGAWLEPALYDVVGTSDVASATVITGVTFDLAPMMPGNEFVVLVRTGAGNVFKLGNFRTLGSGEVAFDYQFVE